MNPRPTTYLASDPWSLLRMALDYFDHPAGDCTCDIAEPCAVEDFAGFLSVCRAAVRRHDEERSAPPQEEK